MNASITPFLAQTDLLTPLTGPGGGVLVGDVLLMALTLAHIACVTSLVVSVIRLHRDELPQLAFQRLGRHDS